MTHDLCIAITGAGAPQSPTLIRHLKGNNEKSVRIVALDMDKEASGGFFADAFHQILPAGDPGYAEVLLDVLRRESPDAILNVSGADVREIAPLAPEIEKMGVVCIGSSAEGVALADNKYELYKIVDGLQDVEAPDYRVPQSLDAFVAACHEMGYPDRDLCFKPFVGKGSRGFRILTERYSRRDLLLEHKPTARYMSLNEFVSIFSESDSFPDLLLMEVADGEEIDAMTIAYKGEALLTTCKTRESHRWGVIDRGELVERPLVEKAIAALVAALPLGFNISLQFIGTKLIEINPRTSTFIYQDELNEPWLAVKLALGLISPDEVRACRRNIRMGRRMVRYMDQIFYEPGQPWSN